MEKKIKEKNLLPCHTLLQQLAQPLPLRYPRVRGLAQGEHFPQDHPEGPHVRLGGKYPVGDALDGQPLDGQRPVGLFVVVVGTVDVLGQAEVADLDDVVGRQEDVPAGQVAVHDLLAGQIVHASADLRRHIFNSILYFTSHRAIQYVVFSNYLCHQYYYSYNLFVFN